MLSNTVDDSDYQRVEYMQRKWIAKGVSLILAISLGFGGNNMVSEVYAASDSVADPMAEIVREDQEIAAQFREEDEEVCAEEPEDYSWMEKLVEEQQDEVVLQSGEKTGTGRSTEAAGADGIFLEDTDPMEESRPSEDVDVFQAPEEEAVAGEKEPAVSSPEVFSDGVFSDGSDPVFDSPEKAVPSEQSPEESAFTYGDPEELFSEGEEEEPGSELSETEAVLQMEEGEDFITELNILL